MQIYSIRVEFANVYGLLENKEYNFSSRNEARYFARMAKEVGFKVLATSTGVTTTSSEAMADLIERTKRRVT